MAPSIHALSLNDLDGVVTIHFGAFPDSALTRLGREAVRRYYEWQLIGPHETANVGIYEDRRLLGFCFCGVFRGALGGFLEENRSFLVHRVISHPWLLLNPLFRQRASYAAQRVFRRLKPIKPPRPAPNTSKPIQNPSFGILSIAVDPQYQGSGIAKLLMEHTEQVAVKRGFSRMNLTVHPSNTRAIKFYEKMGWQKELAQGAWEGSMSKLIGSEPVDTS